MARGFLLSRVNRSKARVKSGIPRLNGNKARITQSISRVKQSTSRISCVVYD